jgi:hypothetical protein
LPASLIESTDDHQVLATLEEVEFKLSQFPKSYDIDSISTSMSGTGTVQGRPNAFMMQGLIPLVF